MYCWYFEAILYSLAGLDFLCLHFSSARTIVYQHTWAKTQKDSERPRKALNNSTVNEDTNCITAKRKYIFSQWENIKWQVIKYVFIRNNTIIWKSLWCLKESFRVWSEQISIIFLICWFFHNVIHIHNVLWSSPIILLSLPSPLNLFFPARLPPSALLNISSFPH